MSISSSTKDVFLAPDFLPIHWDLRFLRASLVNKVWGKERHSAFFPVLCNQVPHFIQQWVYIFPCLPFVTMALWKPFLLSLKISLARFSYIRFLAFPFSSLDAWTTSLYSSQITHLCFLFLFEFGQVLLIHPHRPSGISFFLTSCSVGG